MHTLALHWPPGTGWPAGAPDWAWPAAGVGAVAVLAAAAWMTGRRRRPAPATSHELDAARQAAAEATLRRWRSAATTLTVLAAGIATATALNGMWHVFGDALGLDWPARLILVGFLEIPLVTSAIRARVAILEGRAPGSDGAAVWVLAALSAGLSAADATTWLARALRLVVPLVAAWMWHQSLAADRRHTHPLDGRDGVGDAMAGIAWRWTPYRIAVRVGLADPTHRPGSDVDRARRLARLTKARLRLAVLSTPTPRPLAWLTLRPIRRAIAAWRLQRHALAAVEHLHLGADPTITATITTTVAAVVGLANATDPATLSRAAANPWTPTASPSGTVPPSGSVAWIGSAPAEPRSHRDADHATSTDPVTGPRSLEGQGPARSDRQQLDQRSSVDRIDPASGRRPTRAIEPSITARPEDVARLRQLLDAGAFDGEPTVDAVRRELRISPNYARAARAAVFTGVTADQASPDTPTGWTAHNVPAANRTGHLACATDQNDNHHDDQKNDPENEQKENRNRQPGMQEVTSRTVHIEYPTKKAQETRTEQGTDAVRLP